MNQILANDPHGAAIAIISSMWHADLVARARAACVDELQRRGWPPDRLQAHEVPGAFEIPLLAQTLVRRGGIAAVVACALVVDGGIYRHDFVAGAVIDRISPVAPVDASLQPGAAQVGDQGLRGSARRRHAQFAQHVVAAHHRRRVVFAAGAAAPDRRQHGR
ncbi:MAG: 6,7-dimethyl-8-ribityllumazine synthase [Piscinibacter sp.]|nr:6,7-dimethyl-8-ribityllumazine synthase [Piscinibacter sp.]